MASSSSSSLPDWALIDRFIFRMDDDSFPSDEPTEAVCTNSRGDKVRVCFQVHHPPRPSRLYLSWPGGTGVRDAFGVVAAHRDVLLFQMVYPVPVPRREYPHDMCDYFLYRAGGGGGTASLHRLPSMYGTLDEFRALFQEGTFPLNQNLRRMDGLDIGVLRRGDKDDDIAVAELHINVRSGTTELNVIFPYKSKSCRWKVKKPRVIHGPELDVENLLWNWAADAVIPFGDYLCWVDYCQGAALLCRVLDDTDDESPELQFLALPAKLPGLDRYHNSRSPTDMYMTLDADEENGVLKYVLVTGADGMMIGSRYEADCPFVAATWTLQIRGSDEMVWAIGNVVKSEDICVLDEGFAPFPCGPFQYPHVSLSNPNIVYFVVKEELEIRNKADYGNIWVIAVDMPRKILESSFQYIKWEEGLSTDEYAFVQDKCLDFQSFIHTEFPKFLKLNHTR